MSVFTNLEKIKDALLSRKCKSPIKDSKLWESKTDKLPNSQLYTLKSAAKNMTLISLKITKKHIQDEELPHYYLQQDKKVK